MELIREMDIKATDFFNAIVTSLIYDISTATGETIDKDKLCNGYSYMKNMEGKATTKGNIRVTIEELKEPSSYQARFTSAKGDNYLRYEIEKINEEKIKVKYSESFDGNSKANGWNYKLVTKFYKKKFDRRSNAMLDSIEQWVISNS